MRLNRNLLVPAIVLLASVPALAQKPNTDGIGRTATADEVRAWDITIGPEGKELPPGSGTAKQGAPIFAAKCAVCHGPNGEEGRFLFGRLVGGGAIDGSKTTYWPVISPGGIWPFATSIWGFIYRAMPEVPIVPNSLPEGYLDPPGQLTQGHTPEELHRLDAGGGPFGMQDQGLLTTGVNPNLTADQIYALTAFILYKNNIIKEDEVMDQKTLPKVQMPNRNGFIPMNADGTVPVWHSRDPKVRIEPHVSPNSKPLSPDDKPVNASR